MSSGPSSSSTSSSFPVRSSGGPVSSNTRGASSRRPPASTGQRRLPASSGPVAPPARNSTNTNNLHSSNHLNNSTSIHSKPPPQLINDVSSVTEDLHPASPALSSSHNPTVSAHQRGRSRIATSSSRRSTSQSTSPSKLRYNPICTIQRFCLFILGAITVGAIMMASVPGLIDEGLEDNSLTTATNSNIASKFKTMAVSALPIAQEEEQPVEVKEEPEVEKPPPPRAKPMPPAPTETEEVPPPTPAVSDQGVIGKHKASSKFEQLATDTKTKDKKPAKIDPNLAKPKPTAEKLSSSETEASGGNKTAPFVPFADQSVPHAGYFPTINTDTIPVVELAPARVSGPIEIMRKQLYPTTPDGYPLPTPPRSKLYSSFYCIGGRGREGTPADRSCRFTNLCYKPATDSWLYYQDPAEKDMVILLDHGKIISSFPNQFLNLRSLGIEKDARYWAPTQVFDSIPASAFVERKDQNRPDIHILYHPHYPSNIGHVVGDDFYPIFNLMQSFSMITNDAQLILQRDCAAIFPDLPKKAELCEQFLIDLSPGMSQRPIVSATDKDFVSKLKGTNNEVVCFEHVIAGTGPSEKKQPANKERCSIFIGDRWRSNFLFFVCCVCFSWGIQSTLGKSSTWWAYHNFYLSNMGFNADHTPKKHRITISVTDGKRSLFNQNELIAHVKEKFPDIQVEAVELYKLGGWKNELNYLLNTTVLITPWGGVSMSAMFLPHHASLIVIDYYNTLKQNTAAQEDKLWSNLGYVRPFHYPFTEEEVIMEEPGKKRDNSNAMRDWGRVKVDLPRMESVIKAAIKHVDNFMTFGID